MASTKTVSVGTPLSLQGFYTNYIKNSKLELSSGVLANIQKGRDYLNDKIERSEHPIYGINTGFGSLYNISIEGHDLQDLQVNLVRSHACGTGAQIDQEAVALMLWLKVQSLSLGHSGISTPVVQRLIDFYNNGVYPVVFEQGSLGASGDLAPLAHLSLPLLGEGKVYYKGKLKDASEILEKFGWEPIKLQSKEGLALLNGTQFMSGLGCFALFKTLRLCYLADVIGALSLDAYDGRPEPFNELIHKVRPHFGQLHTAANTREFLEGSALIERPKEHVQDPYSFRCMPQVHGASKQILRHVADVLLTEINAVTDNPTVFPDEDEIISGGNFHGQPLALALDYLAMGCAEWASISERRTYLMISGQRDLPAFLVARPGLNSGLMIAQYTAAGIVSQNKQLCTPASVDSIVSSNGQEDHVSMGANAATKLLKVVDNLETVLAIELLTASQAHYFRKDDTSPFLRDLLTQFRAEVPVIDSDRILSQDISAAKAFIENLEIDEELLFSVLG